MMQTDMFDKPIAEIRAVQIVNNATGQALSLSLEFRFYGEEKWNPVKLEVFGIDMKENEDGSGSTATEENTAA